MTCDPSLLNTAARIAHHARVAALLAAVEKVRFSAEERGIPSPESLHAMFRAERAMTDYVMYEETHA